MRRSVLPTVITSSMWPLKSLKSNTAPTTENNVTSEHDNKDVSAVVMRGNSPMRVVVVGNSGVGKTALVRMFATHEFVSSHLPTVGIDFGVRTIAIPNKSTTSSRRIRSKPLYSTAVTTAPTKNIKLQLWDCAGQEKFRSITRSYYRDARGVLLMFDLHDRSSFRALDQWLREIVEEVSEQCVIWIVGNKKDKVVDFHKNNTIGSDSYDADDECEDECDVQQLNPNDQIAQQQQQQQQQPKTEHVQREEINEWISKNGLLRYVECCVKYNPIDRNIDDLFREFAIELDRVFNHPSVPGFHDNENIVLDHNNTTADGEENTQDNVNVTSSTSSCCFRS